MRAGTAPRIQPLRRGPVSAGFALLEALVALTLLAGTGLALFAWIQQNTQAASRLQMHAAEARLLMSAQSMVQLVNPMSRSEGEIDAGDLRVSWRSELLEPERRNQTFGDSAEGPFRVGLYRLEVKARDLRQEVEINFAQWQVGTRRDSLQDTPP
jgi:general secretion pathway protein I